jgi:Lar family restriction alleviation protein
MVFEISTRKTNHMMSKEELKPCPFCGGKAEMITRGNEATKKRSAEITCTSCRATQITGAIRGSLEWCQDTAIEKWNKRQSLSKEQGKSLENCDCGEFPKHICGCNLQKEQPQRREAEMYIGISILRQLVSLKEIKDENFKGGLSQKAYCEKQKEKVWQEAKDFFDSQFQSPPTGISLEQCKKELLQKYFPDGLKITPTLSKYINELAELYMRSHNSGYSEADMIQAFAEGHARFTECNESELELKADNYLKSLTKQ